MRTLLLRLLLLAVFFNTAIGVPLHETEHARNALYAGLGASAVAQAPSAADEEPTDSQAHQACVWCCAHAQAFGFAATGHAVPVAPAPCIGRLRAASPEVAAADSGQWRPFAPRGPPAFLG